MFMHLICNGYHYTLTAAQWIDFLALMKDGDSSALNALMALQCVPDAPATDVTNMTDAQAYRLYRQYLDSLK